MMCSTHRIVSVMIVLLSGFVAARPAVAQFPARQPTTGTASIPSSAQPGVQPQGSSTASVGADVQMEIRQERPSPEMMLLLQEWESRTSGIDTLQGSFRKYDYDFVFLTEKRAIGKYWFGSPDKARMDFQSDPDVPKLPADPNTGKPQHEAYGKSFSVVGHDNKSWICTGKEILEIDHDNKHYNRMEIPAQFHGQRITDGPMPFLFGMKAQSVSQRYKLAFGSRHDPSQQIHIVAYPLVPGLQKEFRKAELFLNPETYLPQAVRLSDPSGNMETVYVFYEPAPFKLVDRINGPWKVYLGPPWKLIHDRKVEDHNELPMHEKREARGNSLLPGLRRTAEGNSSGLTPQ